MQLDMTNRPNSLRRCHIFKALSNKRIESTQRLKGVLAQMHWGRPRMVLLALEGNTHIANADNVRHHTNGFARLVKPRALLNMHLNKARKLLWIYKVSNLRSHSPARLCKSGACAVC